MTRFRSAASQAKYLVAGKSKHGHSRHKKKNANQKFISSVGTELTYRGNVKRFITWLKTNRIETNSVSVANAEEFLKIKSESVSQKTLDSYRQSLQLVFLLNLKYLISKKTSFLTPRAYRIDQIDFLRSKATLQLSLSIAIAVDAGLRAIELDTIGRITEMEEDQRDWLPERFTGREDCVAYVVCGKGGLRRKVFLSMKLSIELENTRLPLPIKKTQRGINYTKRYSIIGGHTFSQQFSRLSFSVLDWSTGAHGLRHKYAQDRIRYLQRSGFHYQDALKIVSQELGHFSINNTLAYLR